MPSAGPGATGAAGAADHEPLTEELLARLLASATPQEYLDQTQVGERDFAAYLRSLLQQKGLTRADVLRACDVSPSFGYQVFQGTRRPSRDTAIALAFGLGCSLREAQRLLRSYSALSTATAASSAMTSCFAWARRPSVPTVREPWTDAGGRF